MAAHFIFCLKEKSTEPPFFDQANEVHSRPLRTDPISRARKQITTGRGPCFHHLGRFRCGPCFYLLSCRCCSCFPTLVIFQRRPARPFIIFPWNKYLITKQTATQLRSFSSPFTRKIFTEFHRWSTLNHRLFTLVLTLLFGANFRPFSSGRIPPGESATGALWRGAHTQTRNRLIVSRLSSLDPAGSSRSFEHVQLIRRFRQTSNYPQNLPKFERVNVLICK